MLIILIVAQTMSRATCIAKAFSGQRFIIEALISRHKSERYVICKTLKGYCCF